MLLTFSAFDADQFVKGVGELDVRVNGNLVVNIPAGLIHLTGTGSFAPFNERWVFFGPFDITGSIIPGANTITFTNPLDDHASRVRNVTITSNDQLLLSFRGTSSITPDHGLRLIFLSAPLVFASLTVSPSSVVVGEETTFTAAYTGGAGPFTCIFRFGDDTSARVTSQGQSCTAAHTYDNDGLVTVRVTVRDRAGNTVSGKLSIAVNSDEENADPIPLLVTVVKPVGRPYE